MNVVAIIQARYGSTRLPGKALLPAPDERPLLEIMLERVNHAALVDEVCVAVPYTREDGSTNDTYEFTQKVYQLTGKIGASFLTGPEENVLTRIYQAAQELDASYIVRLTGDCPLVDPAVIDHAVSYAVSRQRDYVFTGPSYPEGFGVEVLSGRALWLCHHLATEPFDREHVTPYIWKLSDSIVTTFELGMDGNHDLIRLTVDYPEDYRTVCKVLEVLGPDLTMQQVIALHDNQPELFLENQHIRRDEWKLEQPS